MAEGEANWRNGREEELEKKVKPPVYLFLCVVDGVEVLVVSFRSKVVEFLHLQDCTLFSYGKRYYCSDCSFSVKSTIVLIDSSCI